jgi:hypothetical protein
MVFINMRIFKTILVLLMAFSSLTEALPVSSLRLEHRDADDGGLELPLDVTNAPELSDSATPKEDYFDQRQNGTENYRIHVDGLVLVVAPVEALLLASGMPDNISDSYFPTIQNKPPSPPPLPVEEKPTEKPSEAKPEIMEKSVHRPHLRLVSLLGPMLKKFMAH